MPLNPGRINFLYTNTGIILRNQDKAVTDLIKNYLQLNLKFCNISTLGTEEKVLEYPVRFSNCIKKICMLDKAGRWSAQAPGMGGICNRADKIEFNLLISLFNFELTKVSPRIRTAGEQKTCMLYKKYIQQTYLCTFVSWFAKNRPNAVGGRHPGRLS